MGGAGQGKEAQQLAARHALQAVFAARERRLQEHEIDHLRESERRHREVDALAADRDHANDGADQRRDDDAGEHAELGRPAGRPHQPAGAVRRAREIRGMAERQQAGVAEQQVEGAGEDGVAERRHHEDRIEAQERRGDEQQQAGDQAGARQRGILGAHQASLPNRPAGRTIRTMAMITKTTMLDASG